MADVKIGFTERGDAAQDFSWADACRNGKVDGAILITKDCTPSPLWTNVLALHDSGFPIMVHATITGWGGSAIEPNVPPYQKALDALADIIHGSFPADHVVLRISVLDEYPHVKERFRAAGWPTCYPGNAFQASKEQFKAVADMLGEFIELQRKGYRFETCAEPLLGSYDKAGILEPCGCLSIKDLKTMGFVETDDYLQLAGRPKQRESCLCLPYKKELLKNKTRCPHQCAYCYWKD